MLLTHQSKIVFQISNAKSKSNIYHKIIVLIFSSFFPSREIGCRKKVKTSAPLSRITRCSYGGIHLFVDKGCLQAKTHGGCPIRHQHVFYPQPIKGFEWTNAIYRESLNSVKMPPAGRRLWQPHRQAWSLLKQPCTKPGLSQAKKKKLLCQASLHIVRLEAQTISVINSRRCHTLPKCAVSSLTPRNTRHAKSSLQKCSMPQGGGSI